MTGLEPAIYAVTGHRFNQLSYIHLVHIRAQALLPNNNFRGTVYAALQVVSVCLYYTICEVGLSGLEPEITPYQSVVITDFTIILSLEGREGFKPPTSASNGSALSTELPPQVCDMKDYNYLHRRLNKAGVL